jgi:transposase
MNDKRQWFAGVDWASESHLVRLVDQAGHARLEKVFEHSGEGLHAMAEWLLRKTGVPAGDIHVAIEVPHGPVVETLLERGFNVYSINPKQLDRLRDRFTIAGAKDDSLDGLVLGSCLRSDPHCFRKLDPADPIIIELREWSRIHDTLTRDRTRLTHRLDEQLWRYFPAVFHLEADLHDQWLLALLALAPTPDKAARLRSATVAVLLKRYRVRRLDADQVLAILRQKPVALLPGTTKAAIAQLANLIPAIRLLNQQIRHAEHNLDRLLAQLVEPHQAEPGQPVEQHDAVILASLPGIGRTTVATLLTEPGKALQARDYHALRSLTGVAPVTRRSGKACIVIRRLACNPRLVNAVYHWARGAMQRDPLCRAKYKSLRDRGHSHGRALRSLADRLLNVACAMLRDRTLFDPTKRHKFTLDKG